MTDTQLYLAVGLPVIAILVSTLINMLAISGIRGDIGRIDRRLELIEPDLKMFYKTLGKHATDIARLKDKTGLD